MNLHKHRLYLFEQHSESFKIWSTIIRINSECNPWLWNWAWNILIEKYSILQITWFYFTFVVVVLATTADKLYSGLSAGKMQISGGHCKYCFIKPWFLWLDVCNKDQLKDHKIILSSDINFMTKPLGCQHLIFSNHVNLTHIIQMNILPSTCNTCLYTF